MAVKDSQKFTVVIVVLGIGFHLLYTYSVVDIYFRTPLIQGMQPVPLGTLAPAKRVVLIVADGLRADKFFELQHETPFLRSMIETKGKWGLSHTRVPTESRPGLVALLAGFWEDVSSVTTGWKDNPVDFDSVVNQAVYSWSWGSPDVVAMFAKSLPHAYRDGYPNEYNDYSREAWLLDEYVFNKTKEFFNDVVAHPSSPNATKFAQEGVFLFLHLGATDMLGHTKRPYSNEYIDHIRRMDGELARFVARLEGIFPDHSTAYVFTADHGMTDKGNHGDGDPTNTETPLVCWGAGIAAPVYTPAAEVTELNSPPKWGLTQFERNDIVQADVAPLISALLGRPYPLNSIGEVPLKLMSVSPEEKAKLKLANAKQIEAQLTRKSQVMKDKALFFTEFSGFQKLEALIAEAEALLGQGSPERVVDLADQAIGLIKQGLNFYHRYDRPFLMSTIILGYAGWIAFVLLNLVTRFANVPSQSNSTIKMGVILLGTAGMVWLALEKSPVQYFLYLAMPTYFWSAVLSDTKALRFIAASIASSSKLRGELVGLVLAAVAAAEISSLGFFWREVFSICFVGMALWGWYQYPLSYATRVAWAALNCTLALFPLIPPTLGVIVPLVLLSGLVACGWSFYLAWDLEEHFHRFFATSTHKSSLPSSRRKFLVSLPLVATAAVALCEWAIATHSPIVPWLQGVTWIVFIASILTALGSGASEHGITLAIFSGLSSAYLILSVSFEGLFFITLSILLVLWLSVESTLKLAVGVDRQDETHGLSLRSARVATFYLLFCCLAFFGTGNIASLGSFELASTYRLVTTWSPFLMMVLLLSKVAIPFILLSGAYGLLTRILRIQPLFLGFIIVALLTDIMAINFFFLVTDEGSWRDIGMSISRYAICCSFLVFQLLMAALSSWLLRHLDSSY